MFVTGFEAIDILGVTNGCFGLLPTPIWRFSKGGFGIDAGFNDNRDPFLVVIFLIATDSSRRERDWANDWICLEDLVDKLGFGTGCESVTLSFLVAANNRGLAFCFGPFPRFNNGSFRKVLLVSRTDGGRHGRAGANSRRAGETGNGIEFPSTRSRK